MQLVRSLQPQALILDIAMPNMNGLEALPKITLASPGTKVVVLSSMVPLDGVKSSALALGAVAVFNKDIPPEKLLDVFRRKVPMTRQPGMDALPNRAP